MPELDTPRERPGWIRRAVHPFVPAGFHDPIGLARRLIQSGDPAALFAMRSAALAPLVMPLDLLLVPFERRSYRRGGPPNRLILLVCGSARSGTTLTAQILIRNLALAHLDNLMALFPRSPLTASRLFGRFTRPVTDHYSSFYGRTRGWAGHSDALNLWDRWLGSDRTRPPQTIPEGAQRDMVAFFGALERQAGRAVLCKNNSLDASAHLVAEALPTARFICVERDRESLALSLLKARMEIHGRPDRAYGLAQGGEPPSSDPVEDVCRQVLYHEELAVTQEQRLGPGRFLRVQFQEICNDPRRFVLRVGRELLGEQVDPDSLDPDLVPFKTSKRSESPALRERIQSAFVRLLQHM